jgi:hypothetical protein
MMNVRLTVDWAGEVFLDLPMPMLEVGMKIVLPFSKQHRQKEEDPEDKTRIFIVQDFYYYAHVDPPLLMARVDHDDDSERLLHADFLASGWKPMT